MKISHLLPIFILLCLVVADPTPPNYSSSFEVRTIQTYISKNGTFKVNSYVYFDPVNNKERVDRAEGRYNIFCGSILPNVSTPCVSLASQGKRYYYFPQKRLCCRCCTYQDGCGPMKPDWLSDAKYLGNQSIQGKSFDKWSKDGVVGYNYFWVTADSNKTPRRLDQNGVHITDYYVNTFINKTIEQSIFKIPDYCGDKICSKQSFCGHFQNEANLQWE